MTRRTYSREFKTEAVKLITERGFGVAQASRDLDVGDKRSAPLGAGAGGGASNGFSRPWPAAGRCG